MIIRCLSQAICFYLTSLELLNFLVGYDFPNHQPWVISSVFPTTVCLPLAWTGPREGGRTNICLQGLNCRALFHPKLGVCSPPPQPWNSRDGKKIFLGRSSKNIQKLYWKRQKLPVIWSSGLTHYEFVTIGIKTYQLTWTLPIIPLSWEKIMNETTFQLCHKRHVCPGPLSLQHNHVLCATSEEWTGMAEQSSGMVQRLEEAVFAH